MSTRNSLIVILIFMLATTLASFFQSAPLALAQEAPAGEAAPAAAPAAGAPAPAEPKPVQRSRFLWFIQSSGLIGLGILILSIYFVATIIRLFIELRPIVAMPPEEVAQA